MDNGDQSTSNANGGNGVQGVTPSSTGVSLIPLSVDKKPSGDGWQEVSVDLGIKNSGSDITGATVNSPTLTIAEGQTYTPDIWLLEGPLPPGITICGDYGGPFAAHFSQVPVAGTPKTLSMSSELTADLSSPVGSCPAPSMSGIASSAEAKSGSNASDPGFSISFAGLQTGGNFDYKGATAPGFTVNLTVANHDSLNAITLVAYVLTDKGYLAYYDNFEHFTNPNCEDKISTVGPGQTRAIPYCFLTVDDQGNNIGNPLAVLLVSSAQDAAYGLVTVSQ